MGHFTTLDLWRGDFGNSYHARNRFSVEQVKPVFDRILDGIQVDSVLEVGCGLGHNLMAVDAAFRVGVEPNEEARREANERYGDPLRIEFNVVDGNAADLSGFVDGVADLVLTCGLLIHIPPDQIQQVVKEIARVSSKYVLCIEYAAVEEEEVPYRDHRDILWRRPYGKLFQAWAGMKLVSHDAADSNLYPGCEWWLLSK